jgi:prevent-host-death family protein
MAISKQRVSETIAANVFKTKCLTLLDEVAKTGKEIVITRQGKKIARLIPMNDQPEEIWGRMKGSAKIHGDIFSTGEKWNADSDEPDPLIDSIR